MSKGWRARWQYELEHDLALSDLREAPEYTEIVATIREDMERQWQTLGTGPNAATGSGE